MRFRLPMVRIALGASLLFVPGPASAQGSGDWAVVTSPFAELWYHGLALLAFGGPGELPYHDAAYVRRMRSRGADSPLERTAGELGGALRADPAFEVLHFVPVYFNTAGVSEALDALGAVARTKAGTAQVDVPVGNRMRAAAELMAGLLPGPAQRATLGRLVEVLGDEWSSSLRADWTEQQPVLDARARALQKRWTTLYVPALSPYLERERLKGGWIVVTRPVGLQGRVFTGDARNATDNVVVVGLGPEQDGLDVTLTSVVRELCYPAVREALEQVQDRYADPERASRASDRAATWCGAFLLEGLPEASRAYRERFGFGDPNGFPAGPSLPGSSGDTALLAALKRLLSFN